MDTPWETITRVSPDSSRTKTFAKWPLVLTALSAGCYASLYVATIKLVGEMIVNGCLSTDFAFILAATIVSACMGFAGMLKIATC